jgi:hypothetical protein
LTSAKVPIPTPDAEPTPANLPLAAKFARALAGVQPVHKTKTAKVSDTFTYRYASITDTLEAVKTACLMYGLALAQPIHIHELGDRCQIMTMVIDMDTGESLTFGGPVFPVKGEPQATGSALTYYRRYALTTLFALNVDDDDGAQAQRAEVKPEQRTEAEVEIRKMIGTLSKDAQSTFADDFKAHFGCTLRALPESRHGDALGWAKAWSVGIVQEVMEL